MLLSTVHFRLILGKILAPILRLFIASIRTQHNTDYQVENLYADCHKTYPAESTSNDQL